MCGIAGFLGYGGLRTEALPEIALRMGNAIRHRGPDDSGVWRDDAAQLVLIHRRLSVLDLSPAGHQPMVSPSGRYVLVFNGEIYNHLALREELERRAGPRELVWRGRSDTETLLAGIEIWGVEATLKRTVGMFALALWNRDTRTLCLARDRIGEKPLYYGWQRGVFLFGSELKALRTHPAFAGEIDRDAMTLQLRHSYVPAPYSIYKGIGKLLPGHLLQLSTGVLQSGDKTLGSFGDARPYWSLADAVERGRSEIFTRNDDDAISVLHRLLRDAVAQQMVADVPVGVFLSGGMDSSTIAALMQHQSARPVRTFTIGFNEADYNEVEYARAVARHLGTEHTELYVTPRQALDVVPRLPVLYDEPFSDPSQIPTFLVAELARRHVTVSLSGDAGDELFGGYDRYTRAANFWRLPGVVRASAVKLAGVLGEGAWGRVSVLLNPFLPGRFRNLGEKMRKLSEWTLPDDPMSFYRLFVSHWSFPEQLVRGGVEPNVYLLRTGGQKKKLNCLEAMMRADLLTYLPDGILVKVDRAAMGVSLETRVPFLDHRVVEFVWRLPLSMKIRNGQQKWILKQILYKYLPTKLVERPKMGFGIPLNSWLRGPLRDWAEALLDESSLEGDGFFNPGPIRQKWSEHISGKRDWHYHLWDVLMFQAWLAESRQGVRFA